MCIRDRDPTGTEPEEGSVPVGSNAVVLHRAGAGRGSEGENSRALAATGQVGPAVVRPKREVLYDVSHGVDMRRGATDEEKDAAVLDKDGKMPKTAYKDLRLVD